MDAEAALLNYVVELFNASLRGIVHLSRTTSTKPARNYSEN